MLVKRDFFKTINENSQLEAVLLWGPRQVGKSTLLEMLNPKSHIVLDDLSIRAQAQNDPAFLLNQLKYPCLIDEVQYAPNIFPEIKLRIDNKRRENLTKKSPTHSTDFYLTGSNKTLLDKEVKESLSGRCHIFTLHGLSVHELTNHFQDITISEILFKGGLPEVYTRASLNTSQFINDYILTFIEKDISRAAQIEKLHEFQVVLKLLAARTGTFIDFSEIANAANVDSKTVTAWVSLLERNAIVQLVPTYFTNLSKRIVKMKKLYFYDTGICARLQGQISADNLIHSTQAGLLFETLVFSEIIKTKDNFLKDWQIYTWRTKEKNEIDFIIQSGSKFLFLESKLGIQSAKPFDFDTEAKKVFSHNSEKVVVCSGGETLKLDTNTSRVSINNLGNYLLTNLQ